MSKRALKQAIASRERKLQEYVYRAPETIAPSEQRYIEIKRAELNLFRFALEGDDFGYDVLVTALAKAINAEHLRVSASGGAE